MEKAKYNKTTMSESELRKYRLTGLEEPGDELMAALMERAAEEARRKNEVARRDFWKQVAQIIQEREAETTNEQ